MSMKITDNYWQTTIEPFNQDATFENDMNEFIEQLTSLVNVYIQYSKGYADILYEDLKIDDLSRRIDSITSRLVMISYKDKQNVLEIFPLRNRIQKLIEILEAENNRIKR